MKHTIFIDFISVFGFFVNYYRLKKADNILLFIDNDNPLEKIWHGIFRLLNFVFLRKEINVILINRFMYIYFNPEVIQVIEKNADKINIDFVCSIKMFFKGAEQKDVIKYIKRNLIRDVQKKIYIKKQIEQICQNNDNYLVITDKNKFNIFNEPGKLSEDSIIFKTRYFVYPLTVLFVIVSFLKLISKFKLRLIRTNRIKSDLLVQAHAFDYENSVRKEYLSENYVFDKKKVSLLITDLWRPCNNEQLEKFKNKLKEKGIRFIDVKDFVISFSDLISISSMVLIRTVIGCKSIRSYNDFYTYILFVYQFSLETIYLKNFNCKAILCFDDYLPLHVIRTLIYRRYSIKTFGIQHSTGGGLYTNPYLSYICFDKYLIWGEFYRKLFDPFWEDIDTVKLSYNRIDNLLRKWHSKKMDLTQAQSVFGKNKKNILIAVPNLSRMKDYEHIGNAAGMINFLQELDESILDKANIYIRPPHLKGVDQFRKLINNDGVNFVLTNDCSTTELICLSDLVISATSSGIICEASLLRAKFICYDYSGFYAKYWMRFGKDIYLDTADSLFNTIKTFSDNEPLNIDWDYLWNEVVYPNNGNTNQVIENLLNKIR